MIHMATDAIGVKLNKSTSWNEWKTEPPTVTNIFHFEHNQTKQKRLWIP